MTDTINTIMVWIGSIIFVLFCTIGSWVSILEVKARKNIGR